MTAPALTRRRRVALAMTALSAAWCLASLIPAAHPLFSLVCHQIRERSFGIHGVPLPVCARCTGLYFGFLLGCLALVLSHLRARSTAAAPPRRVVLLAAAVPLLIEGAAEITGVWAGIPTARALTGAIFGTVVPFYFIPAVDEIPAEARAEISRLIAKWENAHAATRAR